MPKKKETQKEAHRTFIETIRELHVKVRKELAKSKKGEKTAPAKKRVKKSAVTPKKKSKDNLATQDKKRQLRKSLSEKDIKKLQGKKRKGY